MFKCKACEEKEKVIEFLKSQNKELFDRVMAFNKDAFTLYNAEKNLGEKLFPIATDKDGKVFSYKDIDLPEAREEIMRAFGEDVIQVEEKNG